MEKRIITISREFGSGGRFIGEEVAKMKKRTNAYDESIYMSGLWVDAYGFET